MSSSYRNSLNDWLAQLEVKADRVLDIGGAQETMPKRVKSWEVKEYLIADLPEPHADSPKPDIVLDLNEELDGLPYFENIDEKYLEYFDEIYCLEVFDYVYNPRNAFGYIAVLLKPGGTAWVSFPSVYPLHQPVEDDALRYMPGAIKKLATLEELTIEEIIYRRPETNKWQEFFYAERMRGARNTDHSFTGMIVRFKK